jgi:hypothetical protein
MENGVSNFHSKEILFFHESNEVRYDQVNLATKLALAAHRDPVKGQAAGNYGTHIKNGNFSITFIQDKGRSDDEYAQSRNRHLNTINKILTTFGKQPLPAYTSQNRREV